MIEGVKGVLIGVTQEFSEEETSSALRYGLSLAEQAGAHVTVQAASLKLTLPTGWVSRFASSLLAEENRRLDKAARDLAEAVRREAEAAGVVCSVETPHAPYPHLVADFTAQARVHDIVVVDAEPDTWKVDRGLIEALLTGTGRPLVVVPPERPVFSCRRVLVAWDRSARAARAASDALPFMRQAEAVTVLSIHGEKDLPRTVPGADLAHYLARHGVRVSAKDAQAQGGDVARTLRTEAAALEADLLVMGGYAHSRLRQLVFGGVTQSLLGECPVPLLLSH